MRTGRWHPLQFISVMALAATLLVGVAGPSVESQEIGVTAAINPAVRGTPPKKPTRVLHVGASLFFKERLVTSELGKVHLIFLDGSSLTVGPHSDLVLDEFVYDPDTKTGKLVFAAAKGVFRLVGGRISKKNRIVFKTPTATIGIRGGIAMISVGSERSSATFLFGEDLTITVTNPAGQQVTKTISRPGFGVEISANGEVSDPKPMTVVELTQLNADLEKTSDNSTETEEESVLSDEQVADTEIAVLGSENEPETLITVDSPDGVQETESVLDSIVDGETVEETVDTTDATPVPIVDEPSMNEEPPSDDPVVYGNRFQKGSPITDGVFSSSFNLPLNTPFVDGTFSRKFTLPPGARAFQTRFQRGRPSLGTGTGPPGGGGNPGKGNNPGKGRGKGGKPN